MEDGRFEALGRGIYRTFETDPKMYNDTQKILLEGLKRMKAFLEAQLPEKIKNAEDADPTIAPARRQIVEDIKDEIKWTNQAIIWFNEGKLRLEHFELAQYEVELARKKALIEK